MTRSRSDRAEELFEAARKIAPKDRGAFLASQCPDDPGLRGEVADLLRFAEDHDRPDGFLRSPIPAPGSAPAAGSRAADDPLPARIGPYTIVRRISAGGMGIVYEARQTRPDRTVALKAIRPGLIGPGLRRRFEREAEVLGRLHHPGIAHIYEAGVGESTDAAGHVCDQPYFAMEYVAGQPLDRFCAASGADVRQRLRIFVMICDAVAHAHDRGVVHRDLKPANILIDGDGRPRILDFGVARVLDEDFSRWTLGTATGQVLGTLPYMSPEQVGGNNRDIDARSDVYSLGVMLYESLSGKMPYDVRTRSLAEAARTICEVEPARLGSVDSALRGDLDTIVSRALEKEPERRYASAADLGRDIVLHLDDQPIAARAPGTLYQFRKFARRNRALVGGVLATLVTLIVGTAVATTLALRASRENAELEWMIYRTTLRSAAEALAVGDRPLARQHLAADKVPAALRGWEWRYLWSRSEEEGILIPAPRQEAASPPAIHVEGRTIEYLIDDESLQFDAATGERLARGLLDLSGIPPGGGRILHAGDGHRFALLIGGEAGRVDSTVHLFDRERTCAAGSGLSVTFGPPGSGLAAVIDATLWLRIWDVEICENRHRFPVTFPRFLSDGSLLGWAVSPAVSETDYAVVIYDLSSGEEVSRHPVDHAPRSVALTSTEDRVAAGGFDGKVRLRDVASGALIRVLEAHQSRVLGVAFAPDDARLVTAGSDGWVRTWDLGSGRRLANHRLEDLVQSLQVLDDGTIVALRRDGSISILDAAPDDEDLWVLRAHQAYVYAVAYHPGGEWFATADFGDGRILFWDRRLGRRLAEIRGPHPLIHALRFSRDGSRLIATSGNLVAGRRRTQVAVWDVNRRALVGTHDPSSDASLAGVGHPLDEAGTRVAIGWDPDLDRITVWHVDTGDVAALTVPRRLPPAPRWVSGDGRFAAKDRPDSGTLEIVDLATGTVQSLPPAGPYLVLAFSHGRKKPVKVVAPLEASRDAEQGGETLGVWEAGSGRFLGALRGHTREVLVAVFSPDDRRIATGSRDGTVRFWDSATLDEVARLEGHTFYIKDLAFSPDGSQIVSVSGDRTVRVWDTVTDSERRAAMREAQRDESAPSQVLTYPARASPRWRREERRDVVRSRSRPRRRARRAREDPTAEVFPVPGERSFLEWRRGRPTRGAEAPGASRAPRACRPHE